MTKDLAKITVAHWVADMADPANSAQDWCAGIKTRLEQAKTENADILLIPEYISEQWLHYATPKPSLTQEVAWMAEQGQAIVPLLQELVNESGVALVAGSMPWPAAGGGFVNRAWLLFPDRESVSHDKLVLTPSEKDPAGWNLTTGRTVHIVEWRDVRMAVLICLDIEMPSLSYELSRKDIDLLLVPSMTSKASGYYRVFGCAKARAVELMTAVAVVGCVGTIDPQRAPPYHGGAATYLPCEEVFGYTGTYTDMPVASGRTATGQMLISRDIPVGHIRSIRHGTPEVWPGPWNVDGLQIKE